MNIGEANAVNDVISRLVGCREVGHDPDDLPDDARLLDAVALLAGRAHKTVMAGWDGPRAVDAVREWLGDWEHPAVQAWQDAAAAFVVEVLYGRVLLIDGTRWAVETVDSDGDDLPGDECFLVTEEGGRQLTVRVSVELIEGALS